MNYLEKIYVKLAAKSIHPRIDAPDVNEWKNFLDSLPKSQNSIDKAYNKYVCRMRMLNLGTLFVLNCIGLCFFVLEIPFIIFSNKSINNKVNNLLILEKDKEVGYEDVVPEELFEKYPNNRIINNITTKLGVISRESRQYLIKCIKKYPFKFFFSFSVFKELLTHDRIINTYGPAATVVYVNERNVASPILKEIYTNQGRKFISFMHGEYLLNILQGFMGFTDYYVWDNSYIDSFSRFLRCDVDKYHVYTPKKLQKKWNLEQVIPEYSYTYYFDDETKEEIAIIAKIFLEFQAKGIKCKVRPHPRILEKLLEMKKMFTGILIENPAEIPLRESLAQTEAAVGISTTVLYEAEVEGRVIVINDISNVKMFKNLGDRRFLLLSHEHKLLSDIVSANNISLS